ncbi:MAG: hypothetical protein ACR2ID_11780 [Chthoniobacterales bacterium]
MKKKHLAVVALALCSAFALNSCETAAGTGALIGAGTGAVIASNTGPHGYYRGDGGRTLAGAAIGAGAGALIGAAIDANNATRYGEPRSDYPFGRRVGPGMFESPYPPHQVYNLRGVPHGGLVDDAVGRGYFRKP